MKIIDSDKLVDVVFSIPSPVGTIQVRKNVEVSLPTDQISVEPDNCHLCGAKTIFLIAMSSGNPEPICNTCINKQGSGIMVRTKGVAGWTFPHGVNK